MPMTNPGGGASALIALTDVSVNSNDAGIDGAPLTYSFSAGKWTAQYPPTRQPALTNWNPADKSAQINLSNNNLTGTNSANSNNGMRGTVAHAAGKYYMEFTAGTITNNQWRIGIAGSTFPLNSVTNNSTDYVQLANTGFVYWNDLQRGTVAAFVATNVIGMALDIGNQAIWFRVNGGNWNNNAANNPATNTGGLAIGVTFPRSWFPLWITGSINESVTANFGTSAFQTAAPAGFAPWDIYATNPQPIGTGAVTLTAATRGHWAINGGTITALSFQRNAAGGAIALPVSTPMVAALPGDTLTITSNPAATVTFIPN